MTTAIITFTSELEMAGALFDAGKTPEENLAEWIEGARKEPQLAAHCLDFEIDGYIKEKNCPNCDGTGDVHGFDGEWRGSCNCGSKPDAEVSDIVRDWIKQNGFDGLCHGETECGCHLDDFLICGGDFSECRPAYKFKKRDGEFWMSTNKNWREREDE